MTISRPCSTSHQCSTSRAIPRVSRDVGLPRRRFPCTPVCITHVTSSHPSSLIVGKIRRSRTTHSSRCLVVFSFARIPWYVRCAVQLIQDIRDRSTILLIRSFSHQLSSESTILRHIDENRPHQRALYFSSLLIPRSLQIGILDRALLLGNYNSGSDVIVTKLIYVTCFGEPRYLQMSTTSIYLPSIVTPASDCSIPTFCSLVCFTFSFNSLPFPVLLAFPISHSAFSCNSAQTAISSAYLTL